MAKVVVRIKEGKVEVEVEGVKGPSCVELTKELERSIGRLIRRTKKKDYFEEGGEKHKTGVEI